MADVKFIGGWFCDRLAISFPLPPGDATDPAAIPDAIAANPFLSVDYAPGGRRGRNQGLTGTWQREFHLNGPKGSPGRMFLRHTEVGAGPERSESVYLEFNPAVATIDQLHGVGLLVDALGGELRAAVVHRFDATRDLLGRCDEFVLDDRLRKWATVGAEHRETQTVGAGGPMKAMIYDKRKQMREVHGVELACETTRLELVVRPAKTVDGRSMDGGRVRVPEDRSLGSLGDWPFPAPRTALRRCDAEACDDLQFWGLMLAAQVMGVRSVIALAKRRLSPSRLRDLVECFPVVDVSADWSSTWSSSISLLLLCLQGQAWGVAEERRAA
jgi:hypothetical protein